MDWNAYSQIFIALFAIVDPLGNVPLYLTFTENLKKKRPQVANTVGITMASILGIMALGGNHILHFFNISMDAFQVAGGILLMGMGLKMLQADRGRQRHTPEEDMEAIDSHSVAVIPLTIPLLAGPGAMSTVILFNSQMHDMPSKLALAGICLVIAFLTWAILRLAPQIAQRLSTTVMNISMRIMGLILTAISVEFIVRGLKNLLPGLA
jgi:multiple antibiotic resistance protein